MAFPTPAPIPVQPLPPPKGGVQHTDTMLAYLGSDVKYKMRGPAPWSAAAPQAPLRHSKGCESKSGSSADSAAALQGFAGKSFDILKGSTALDIFPYGLYGFPYEDHFDHPGHRVP